MQALYITLEHLDTSSGFTVVPLQQIVFSSMEFIKAELQRDGMTLTMLLQEHGKAVFLYEFFQAEHIGLFPTLILPTKECISGFGFVALLNPHLLQETMYQKEGIYGKPAGSFMEYSAYRKETEESTHWTVSPVLFTAPQSKIHTLVHVNPVVDESPAFYDSMEEYIALMQEQQAEEKHVHEDYGQYEGVQEYSEEYHDTAEQNTGTEFPSYHAGYVLTQEQIAMGYRVTAVNEDPNFIEQMVGGYYGYLTLGYEGWFTYVLGEGVVPEIDSYLEDTYAYTVQSPDGVMIDASLTIQSYYVEGVLTYQEYYTEI